MYDRHLDSFVKIAGLGSFSKAAAALYVSPNALIKQMNLLERDLGVRLFNRTSHGIALTPAGSSVYASAQQIMAFSRDAITKARALSDQPLRTLRIGLSLLRPGGSVARWWSEIACDHPGIQLETVPIPDDVNEGSYIYNNLGRDIDVTLTAEPLPTWSWSDKCLTRPLYRTPLCCTVPLGHPLVNKPRICLDDLHGYKFLVPHEGCTAQLDRLREDLAANHPQIEVVDCPPYHLESFNRCAREGPVALGCEDWAGAYPSLVNIACDWDYTLTICLIYPVNCDVFVREFVDAVAAQAKLERGAPQA